MERPSRFVASISIALALGALPSLPGCAASKHDDSAKEWDRAQCNQIIPERERKRCLERVESE